MANTTSREFREYKKKLEKLSATAFPEAVAATLNSVATSAHIQSIRNLRERFTLRNRYTEGGVKFSASRPKKDWHKMYSQTGSISPYMDLQDEGGIKRPKRGRKVPLAAATARGGNFRGVVRKRYAAGTLGPGQFVGRPRGTPSRPSGVWERYAKNKRIRMIRNLENTQIRIAGKRWHSDAMQRYGTRAWIEAAFIREARYRIDAIAAK